MSAAPEVTRGPRSPLDDGVGDGSVSLIQCLVWGGVADATERAQAAREAIEAHNTT